MVKFVFFAPEGPHHDQFKLVVGGDTRKDCFNAIRETLAEFGSNMTVFADKKIAAIRLLHTKMMDVDCGRKDEFRAVMKGIGLAQAKYAVEMPMDAIVHAHQFNVAKGSY